MAWTARVSADALGLFLVSAWLLPGARRSLRDLALGVLAAVAALAVGAVLPTTPTRVAYALLMLPSTVAAAWLLALNPGDRDFIRTRLLRRRAAPAATQ